MAIVRPVFFRPLRPHEAAPQWTPNERVAAVLSASCQTQARRTPSAGLRPTTQRHAGVLVLDLEAAVSNLLLRLRHQTAELCREVHGTQSHNTLHLRPRFSFYELVYPGDNLEQITDKWIYGFRFSSRQAILEVHARAEGPWRYRTGVIDASAQNTAAVPALESLDHCIELAGASQAPDDFGFLLSPYRLTRHSLEYLQAVPGAGGDHLQEALVRPRWRAASDAVVLLPDPYRWVIDTHEQYYQPAHEEYTAFLTDPQRSARRVIAGVLKHWMESADDVLDVRDDLRDGELYQELADYRNQEAAARHVCEVAASYIGIWSHQADHVAVEMAALEALDERLSTTMQMWAVALWNLASVRPGRALVYRLTAPDNTRALRRIVYPTDQSTPLLQRLPGQFSNFRYFWLALNAVAVEAAGGWIQRIDARTVSPGVRAARARTSLLMQARAHLQYLGIRAVEQYDPEMWIQVMNRAPLDSVSAQLQGEVNRIVEDARAAGPSVAGAPTHRRPEALDEIQEAADRAYPGFVRTFHGVRLTAGLLIEGYNFAVGLRDLLQASDARQSHERVISMVSASADLCSWLLSFAEKYAEVSAHRASLTPGRAALSLGRSTGYRLAHGAAGAAGIIGGLAQMADEIRQFGDGVYEEQPAAMWGHAIGVTGAATCAISGSLSLGQALAGVAASSIGAWIAAGGAAAILIGNLLAACRYNENEQFARYSIFGRARNLAADPVHLPWAQGALNTGDVMEELRVLTGILHGFTIDRTGQGNPRSNDMVFVQPGLPDSDAVFTVELEQTYQDVAGDHTFWARYTVWGRYNSDSSAIVRIHAGATLILPTQAVFADREWDGRLRHLRFTLRPQQLITGNGRVVEFNGYQGVCRASKVRVRCESNVAVDHRVVQSIHNPREPSTYVEVDTLQMVNGRVSCLDTTYWTVPPPRTYTGVLDHMLGAPAGAPQQRGVNHP